MDEDLKCVIEDLHVVRSVCFHTVGDKTHKAGVYDNLRCSAASSHGGCGAKLVGTIRMSTKFPTLRDCLRELGRLIQEDHGPTCVVAAQKFQAAEKDADDVSTKERPPPGGNTRAKPSQCASRVSRQSTEASPRQGRFLASHPSWSGWVYFILVLWGSVILWSAVSRKKQKQTPRLLICSKTRLTRLSIIVLH
jgi:hypothetical protein